MVYGKATSVYSGRSRDSEAQCAEETLNTVYFIPDILGIRSKYLDIYLSSCFLANRYDLFVSGKIRIILAEPVPLPSFNILVKADCSKN